MSNGSGGAKYAERLIILKEHNLSLLQKLFNIKQLLENEEKKPFILQKSNAQTAAKLLKVLTKDQNCAVNPDEIEKVPGFREWLKPRISELLKVTQPMYSTFCELLEWVEAAQKLLEELATSISCEFSVS